MINKKLSLYYIMISLQKNIIKKIPKCYSKSAKILPFSISDKLKYIINLVENEIRTDINSKESIDISIDNLYKKAKGLEKNGLPNSKNNYSIDNWCLPLEKMHCYEKKIRIEYEIKKVIIEIESKKK